MFIVIRELLLHRMLGEYNRLDIDLLAPFAATDDLRFLPPFTVDTVDYINK